MPVISVRNHRSAARTLALLCSTALASVSILAVAGFITKPALAGDWTGAVSDDWFIAGNWDNNQVPTAADPVTIDTVASNSTVISGGVAISGSVNVGFHAGANGTVTVDGTGSALNTGGNLFVGRAGTGSLDITGGGEVVTGNQGVIGYSTGSAGTVSVTGPDSIWTLHDAFQVGREGTGELVIANGGTVSVDAPPTHNFRMIGSRKGSTGTVTVTGTGSTWNGDGPLTVGSGGTGLLTIRDGGSVSDSVGIIGSTADGVGTAIVRGAGSRWNSSSLLWVGQAGTGALTVSDGGTVSTTQVTIAYETGSVGTLNIGAAPGDPAAAPGIIDAPSIVLGEGDGTINFKHTASSYVFTPDISGAGTVNVLLGPTIFTGENTYTGTTNVIGGATLQIGNGGDAGSLASDAVVDGALIFDRTGELTYAGAISGSGRLFKRGAGVLTLTGDSSVFSGATTLSEGTLTVTGQLGSSSATIGYTGSDPNATATARVSGPSASWVNSGSVSIGANGKGALIVENGGDVVSSGDNHIGSGGGVVTVTGSGSTWTTDRIMVGHDGAGELNISDGGEVNTSAPAFIGGWVDFDGTGTATVSGAGSTWNANASLIVGFRDRGELTIANGGEVNQESAIIGGGVEVSGTVLVTGEGSKWISRGNLLVGRTGVGELTVEAGGYVESVEGFIGTFSDPRIQGAVTVTGKNSRWVNSGGLYVGGGKGTLTIADGGVVAAGGGITLGPDDGDNGTLNIGAAAGDAPAAAGVLTTPSIEFGNGAGTLVFNHSDSDYVFSTALQSTGTHIIDHIGGVTILTGDSSGFSGNTIVHGGTLAVNGTLGGTVNVESGGTLGGSGMIGGNVDVDGNLSAGNSPGTLTIAGDLTLNATSTSVFELNTPGVVGGTGAAGNDLVDVGGDLTLGGALDARVAAAGYYRLFGYGGTLTGTFDSGTLTGTGGFAPLFPDSPDIRYDTPQQVNLSVLAAGQAMQFWDGGDATGNGTVDGGAGTWLGFATNWTDSTGSAIDGWGGSVGVFAGAAGTVTVDGTQAFDTLQFSTDGYALTSGTLVLSPASGTAGTLNIDNGVAATIGSTIADGTGTSLKKTGGGTLTLTGANTYAGGTQLLGGVLSISSDANLGAASGGLTFDGGTLATTVDMQNARNVTLNVTGSFDVTAGTELGLTGAVSGAGDLLKTGSGTLRLSGTNGYGNTLVQDGTLIGDAGSISGDIGNDAKVIFDQNTDGTVAGNIGSFTAPGGIMVKQGAGNLTLTGPSALDWSIKAGGLSAAAERFDGNADIAGGASLTFDQAANAIYDGTLSGAGQFIKSGAGTLLYGGDSAGFAGNTTIEDGGLIVGSDAAHADATLGGSFNVQDGGILGGHGAVGSGTGSTVTIASGGTIAPGNSIGTLTVNGDLVFDADSTYEAEINPALDSDLIDASGKATIKGGTVHAMKAGGVYTPGSRWTIIGADGGVTGKFDGLTQNMPFVDLALAYDATNVTIDATRNQVAFCDAAQTRNQCATGEGVESTGIGNPVYDVVAALPDEDSARQALDALSGEIHASVKLALIEDSHFVRDVVNDRIRSAFGNNSTPSMPVMAYGPGGPRPVSPDSFGPVAWGHAFGAWGSFDGDGDAAGMETSTGGFLTGIDGEIVSNMRLGLLAGYSRSSFDVDGRASSGGSDNYHLGLYAGGKWDALRLSGGLAYTWHDIETNRSVAFPGFSDSLTGDYNAGTFQAFGEAGYRIDTGAVSFEPFANLAYVSLHTDGFTEKGGASALHVRGETTDTTFTTLGIHLSSVFDLGGMKATAHGTLGWRHAFGDTTPISTHAFAGGDTFDIAGVPIAEDAAIIEAGLDFSLTDTATLGIAYQGQIAGDARQHGFNAKLNVKF